ncbi:MAG: hypothetical protein PT959_04620, partial [Firmicutes bacterium]|nr:hypothetical protein [Bacillota bacterium]
IDPGKISIEVPEGYVSNYITYWTFPMAGYTSLSDIFYKFYDEIEKEMNGDGEKEASYEEIYTVVYKRMAETLMPAENKLRKIFGLDEITEYKDLICLQGYEVTDLIDEARSTDEGNDQENEENINDENSSNAGMNEEMPDADNNSGASGSADAAAPDDTSGSDNGTDMDPGYLIEPDGSDTEAEKETGESGGDGADDDKNYSASDNGGQLANEEKHTDTDSEHGEDRKQENAE